jgi:glycosyltransferase involved in cell wall biosynthesis
MRVFIDIGWMQHELDDRFLRALRSIVKEGRASFDLRVAIDGTDVDTAAAVYAALCSVIPEGSVSAYVLPTDAHEETGRMELIVHELRLRHAAALMPDAGLTVRGVGGNSFPPYLPVVDWDPDDPKGLIMALSAVVLSQPHRPDEEGALNSISSFLQGLVGNLRTEEIADALIRSARLGPEQGCPRLLIDVTYICISDHGTGIQRVVHRISEELKELGYGRRFDEVNLVASTGPDWSNFRYVERIGGRLGDVVQPRTGDILLMLDAAWEAYPHLVDRLNFFRLYNGRVMTVVYDVIPILQPSIVADALPPTFERWFRSAVAVSDSLICISKAVADEVVEVIHNLGLPHRDGIRIGWWHLGSDLPRSVVGAPSSGVVEFFRDQRKTFVMVGTVEPRKGHAVALDAIEFLWKQGLDVHLMILGREGWNVSNLMRRLREHPESGRRLFWQADVSDADITYAYKNSTALLFPSLSEGYGLPIVEAARLGLGTIASDIPVLREVGGEGTVYVPVDDPLGLANAILEVVNGYRPDAASVRTISWSESTSQLLEVLDFDRYEVLLRS